MAKRPAHDRPNIILILCDDLGYGDLGCYGSTLNETPRLDQMAAEGVRFTDFYMPAPLCSPSRAGIMTGCYPPRVGLQMGYDFPVLMPADPIGLNPDEVTIADLLKGCGYATKIIGKWHLGDQGPFLPTRHGFDEYFGLPYSNDMGKENQRYPEFPPLPLMRGEKPVEVEPDQETLTHRYTREAVEYIRANTEHPFFLFFSHMYVHVPLRPPKEFLARAKNGPYGAEVECIDWSTGEILDTLKELGIDENTLVIFTSDNGGTAKDGSSNAPLRGAKASTWEGGMRDPCIMRQPGAIPEGLVCSEICTAMDFLPTVARLAGAEIPADRIIDGKDIIPLMTEPDAKSPYEAFFYYGGNHLRAVRRGKWKLHLDENMLVDLEADIAEQSNVIEDHAEIAEELRRLAEKCIEELGDGEPNRWDRSNPARQTRPGKNNRKPGRVENPVPLLLDPDDPHVQAAYD